MDCCGDPARCKATAAHRPDWDATSSAPARWSGGWGGLGKCRGRPQKGGGVGTGARFTSGDEELEQAEGEEVTGTARSWNYGAQSRCPEKGADQTGLRSHRSEKSLKLATWRITDASRHTPGQWMRTVSSNIGAYRYTPPLMSTHATSCGSTAATVPGALCRS